MNNIFMAMNYRILKSRIAIYTPFFTILIGLVFPILAFAADEPLAGLYGTIDNIFFMCNLIFMFFICAYNCADFKNRTINYEVMNGHKKSEIFWGRTLAFLLYLECGFHITFFTALFILQKEVRFKQIIFAGTHFIARVITIEAIVFAYILYYIVCSFCVKNMITAMLICWLGFGISGLGGLLNDYITVAGLAPERIIGMYAIKFMLLEDFSYRQCAAACIAAIAFILIFFILGLQVFSKKDM